MTQYDVIILGAGSAGLTAYGKLKHHFKRIAMINSGPYGTTCARVGCMPSKVLIQVAEDVERYQQLNRLELLQDANGKVKGDAVMRYVRKLRDGFVTKTNLPLEHFQGDLIDGQAKFVATNSVQVGEHVYQAEHIIVAVGSTPVVPADWQPYAAHFLTSDSVFEQDTIPERLAVIGLGPIGLELGQAFARLGAQVTGFDLAEHIGGIVDTEINQVAVDHFGREFSLNLGQKVTLSTDSSNTLVISNGQSQVAVDKALIAMGRRSNLLNLNLAATGIELNERGWPTIDPTTFQIANSSIYVIGDANGLRPILHEAADQARVVAENLIAGQIRPHLAKPAMGICFTSPNIGFVGARLNTYDEQRHWLIDDHFEMGRNKVIRESGMMRLMIDKQDLTIVGAELFGPKAEHLLHYLALCIDQSIALPNLLTQPVYHPTVEESLRAALRQINRLLPPDQRLGEVLFSQ